MAVVSPVLCDLISGSLLEELSNMVMRAIEITLKEMVTVVVKLDPFVRREAQVEPEHGVANAMSNTTHCDALVEEDMSDICCGRVMRAIRSEAEEHALSTQPSCVRHKDQDVLDSDWLTRRIRIIRRRRVSVVASLLVVCDGAPVVLPVLITLLLILTPSVRRQLMSGSGYCRKLI